MRGRYVRNNRYNLVNRFFETYYVYPDISAQEVEDALDLLDLIDDNLKKLSSKNNNKSFKDLINLIRGDINEVLTDESDDLSNPNYLDNHYAAFEDIALYWYILHTKFDLFNKGDETVEDIQGLIQQVFEDRLGMEETFSRLVDENYLQSLTKDLGLDKKYHLDESISRRRYRGKNLRESVFAGPNGFVYSNDTRNDKSDLVDKYLNRLHFGR